MNWLLWLACAQAPADDSAIEVEADTDTDTDADSDSDTDTDPHEVGRAIPPFALEDINPSSPGFGQVVSREALAGQAYGLLFLDSRCITCQDVMDQVFEDYAANAGWWEALPTYAVQSMGGLEWTESNDLMVDSNDLPYLADNPESSLWVGLKALNHDWYVVGAEGTLEAWLPLYTWPEDRAAFRAFMVERLEE